ncbi:toll/interleukin-1 receptor domain-containing protein [Neosynechococcus sphagnicola]|uniref:toll/interleukin-1 receptor domain-containing protein n=1 Tax=Neosynechococcus sphagnicola TaxID=1501145 RepID=UPI001EFA0458|nr:toll/interleukin-1 receptor domain-containing protein [Neosynechococcus sphagnicola]
MPSSEAPQLPEPTLPSHVHPVSTSPTLLPTPDHPLVLSHLAPDNRPAKIFISHRQLEPELSLAQEFGDAFTAAGYVVFISGQSMQLGAGWAQRVNAALRECDYFLLLLSPQSANSEMVLEEVRTVKGLQAERDDRGPMILPIRLNFPLSVPLNYELRGYLHRVQQRFWRTPADTAALVQEVLDLLMENRRSSVPPEEPTTTGTLPTVPPPCARRRMRLPCQWQSLNFRKGR